MKVDTLIRVLMQVKQNLKTGGIQKTSGIRIILFCFVLN